MDDLPNTFHRQLPMDETLRSASLSMTPESWDGLTLPQVREAMVAWVEKHYLEMVLRKTGGRVGDAAALAGIHPRGLYAKMKKIGLDKADFKLNRLS